MGLIDAIRRAWGTSAPGDDAPEFVPEPSLPRPVIRAEDLGQVPEWMRVPVPEPVLPPVPFIVSRSFEDDLTSWKPPARFLDSLTHAVSADAPSGVIETIAVTAPPDEMGTTAGGDRVLMDAALPLAIRPAPLSDDRAPSPRPIPRAVARAIVEPEPVAAEPHPLLHAATPPELPIVQLPTSEVVVPNPDAVELEHVGVPEEPDVALIGERTDPVPATAPSVVGPEQAVEPMPVVDRRGHDRERTAVELPDAPVADVDGPAPRRIGLGAPIAALPPTAGSLDVASLVNTAAGRARVMAMVSPKMPPVRVLGSPPADVLAIDAGTTARAEGPGVQTWASLPLVAFGTRHDEHGTVPLEALEREPELQGAGPDGPDDTSPSVPLLSFRPILAAAPEEPAPAQLEGSAVRAVIGQRHGVDLSSVPVDRSPEGQASAGRMRARAFTSPGGVVIPAAVGSLDSGPGAALLAHELTHVAQRAHLGSAPPPEQTPAGQTLEAEAVAAELAMTHGGAVITPLAIAAADRREPHAAPASRGHTEPSLPVAVAPRSAGLESQLASVMSRLGHSDGETEGDPRVGQSITYTAEGAVSPVSASPPPATGAAVQRAPEPARHDEGAKAAPDEHIGHKSLWPERPASDDLERLAKWLYPLISFRMRGELREGRERAGMSTDSYARW